MAVGKVVSGWPGSCRLLRTLQLPSSAIGLDKNRKMTAVLSSQLPIAHAVQLCPVALDLQFLVLSLWMSLGQWILL